MLRCECGARLCFADDATDAAASPPPPHLPLAIADRDRLRLRAGGAAAVAHARYRAEPIARVELQRRVYHITRTARCEALIHS
jgi:hypothetical protein